ncbi:hypothetical protein ACLOJK_027871 [Asimina triloba]
MEPSDVDFDLVSELRGLCYYDNESNSSLEACTAAACRWASMESTSSGELVALSSIFFYSS